MKSPWMLVVATALFAAACSGSGGGAVIERRASADTLAEVPEASTTSVCEEIEAFALGSHGGRPLEEILDELARLTAVLGANDALPHLADMRAAATAGDTMAEAMDRAADRIDRATFDTCGIPAFTAMYVTTSFSSCFGRAPIAAGTMVPDSEGCETAIAPAYLPCFDEANGFLPIDCRDGAPVVVRDQDWATP